MAQIDIPESVGRDLYYTYFSLPKDYLVVLTADASWKETYKQYIEKNKLETVVIKPDYSFGKRGKQNLIGLNLTPEKGITFMDEHTGRIHEGFNLNRFLVMPYIPHTDEYYISYTTEPRDDVVIFSTSGGVDIEENWDSVKKISYPVSADPTLFIPDLQNISENKKSLITSYTKNLLQFFRAYGFTFLELNPFVIQGDAIVPLDIKGRLDDCSYFHLQKSVPIYSWQDRIGSDLTDEEREVKELDSLTGASLKLKILNRDGRIWPMVSGGGASILLFDELVEKGMGNKIAFYGEYSGNPSFELTKAYATIILTLLLKSKAKDKVLLIAGANANFTDIAETFRGIEAALYERVAEIKEQNVQILVRRGGPNVAEAFARLQKFTKETGISILIEGTDLPLTHILTYIQ